MSSPPVVVADVSPTQTEKAGNSSLDKCVNTLTHATQCVEGNCTREGCMKMKRVLDHVKGCGLRATASCEICKQLTALCCFHARDCQKKVCEVPFCVQIRLRLKEGKNSSSPRPSYTVNSMCFCCHYTARFSS